MQTNLLKNFLARYGNSPVVVDKDFPQVECPNCGQSIKIEMGEVYDTDYDSDGTGTTYYRNAEVNCSACGTDYYGAGFSFIETTDAIATENNGILLVTD